MAVMTELLPPDKAGPRAVRWVACPGGGALAIDDRKRTRYYRVREFSPAGDWFGRAFELTKPGGEKYFVFLSHRGDHHHCDCAGASYRPQGPCCHVQAMLAVANNGWLTSDQTNPDADVATTEPNHFEG